MLFYINIDLSANIKGHWLLNFNFVEVMELLHPVYAK